MRRGGGNCTGEGSQAALSTKTGPSHDRTSAVFGLPGMLDRNYDWLSAYCFGIQGNLGVSCWEFKFMPEKRVLVLGNLDVQAGLANTVHRGVLLPLSALPDRWCCTRAAVADCE